MWNLDGKTGKRLLEKKTMLHTLLLRQFPNSKLTYFKIFWRASGLFLLGFFHKKLLHSIHKCYPYFYYLILFQNNFPQAVQISEPNKLLTETWKSNQKTNCIQPETSIFKVHLLLTNYTVFLFVHFSSNSVRSHSQVLWKLYFKKSFIKYCYPLLWVRLMIRHLP